MKKAKLRAAAKAELREAAAWYRKRDAAVAERFLSEVHQTLAFVERFPAAGTRVPGVEDPEVKRLPVHGFPTT